MSVPFATSRFSLILACMCATSPVPAERIRQSPAREAKHALRVALQLRRADS